MEDNQKFKIKVTLLILTLVVIFVFGGIYFAVTCANDALNAIENENYNKALHKANICTFLVPFNSYCYSLKGYAKFNLEDFDGAIKDYDKAYKFENDDYKMMNFDNKIFIKYHQKQYLSALEDFDNEINNAKTQEIKNAFLWDKAQFLYNIKRYKDALKVYNTLIIESDNDSIYLLKDRLYFERSEVYKKLQNNTESEKDLEKAQELNLDDTFKNPIPEPVLLLDD